MKIRKIFSLFILFVFVISCGYRNINLQKENALNVKEIILTGDKKIGYILKNEILLISSSDSVNKLNIDLFTNKEKKINNKDSSGKVTKYDIIVTADLIIENLNNLKTVRKNFIKIGSFDVKKKHIDTIDAEKKETKNLTNQIAEEISNYFKILYIN